MPLKLVLNENTGSGLRTIAVEGQGFPRIVFVVKEEDSIKITHPDNDPNKLLVELQVDYYKGRNQ